MRVQSKTQSNPMHNRSPLPSSFKSPTPFIPRSLLLTLPAANRSATSALIMLDSNPAMAIDIKKTKKKKSKAKSSETLEGENAKSRKILLRSIAAFLEINGFDKTLSMLRSEAQIEIDGLRETSIDIEELLCKFLESSQGHEVAAIDWRKETDSQKSEASKKHEIEQHHDACTQTHKKRRKHRIETDDDTNPAVEENGLDNKGNDVNGLENLKSAKEDLSIEIKDKKKKKKPQSISLEENADKNLLEVSCQLVENGDHDTILPNTDVIGKTKKKKKHKMSNENTGSEDHNKIQEIVEEKVAEQNAKYKGEKKRKRKGEEYTKEASVESESIEEKVAASKNDDTTDVKVHKKRKRLESEEKVFHDENGTTTTPQEQDLSAQNAQKDQSALQLAKGDLDNNENEDNTHSKSKKRRIQSGEPKTVNAFQRVKIDEVKFADEKLQDNSYWALDATGSGYGAKAQEVLGQVRGRGFRHEKTKKKRGTYRGGQIDLQSHSIKFNYSDEE